MFHLPSDYNTAERLARQHLSNREIAAFQPKAFAQVGYPIEVTSNAELVRFCDCMHEGRSEACMQRIGALTDWELYLCQNVAMVAANLTASWGDRRVPRAALLSAIPAYREIVRWCPPKGRVFEFGPGSGYLGGLLLWDGYWYSSTDVTQAFYLYQQHLFSWLGRSNPIVEQVPWWEWARSPSGTCDIVTANHCLREMTSHALKFNMNAAAKMLSHGGQLIIDDLGAPEVSGDKDVQKVLEDVGFGSVELPGDVMVLMQGDSEQVSMQDHSQGGERKHDLAAFDAMLERVLGKKMEPTPDEKFLALAT